MTFVTFGETFRTFLRKGRSQRRNGLDRFTAVPELLTQDDPCDKSHCAWKNPVLRSTTQEAGPRSPTVGRR